MLASSFTVSVVQNTIAVFIPGLDSPFNKWSKEAYAQGFSWRPESVSFIVLEDGEIPVEVYLEREFLLRPEAERAVGVPFTVPTGGKLEISGIYEKADRFVQIPKGTYLLVFQQGLLKSGNEPTGEDKPLCWCSATFVPDDSPEPAILKQDSKLTLSRSLVMDGKPA